MTPIIRGYYRSLTIWIAALIGVLSEVLPAFTPEALADLGLDASTVKKVGVFVTITMLVCRHLTTKSLAEKGAPAFLESTKDKS